MSDMAGRIDWTMVSPMLWQHRTVQRGGVLQQTRSFGAIEATSFDSGCKRTGRKASRT
jgi:hypothetical protein